jgi:hypothetical protein
LLELQPGAAAVGCLQHDHFGPDVVEADDRIHPVALYDLRLSLLFESQLEEKRCRRFEIVNGDTDVVESFHW